MGKFYNWFNVIVADRFIPIKKLGSGSFSQVWMSYDFKDNIYVATKLYFSKDYSNGEHEAKVYTELNKLKSNNILKFLGSYNYKNKDNNRKYFINVFDLMLFSSQNILKMDTFYNFGIPYEHTMKIFKKILEGVAEIHKLGYLHGDIKPENILVEGVSNSCKEIMKKLNLQNFVKKKSRSELPKLLIKHIEKNIVEEDMVSDSDSDDDETYSDDDDESEYDSSNYSESESSDASSINSDYDDRISISDSDSEIEDDLDQDKIINSANLTAEKIKTEYDFLMNNCNNIKISDFGSSVKINNVDKTKKHIQTPYYRPPEILLRVDFNEKIDIWALGCILYEYLTGDILFDADDYDKTNYVRHHLFLINQTIGSIPMELVEQTSDKHIVFINNTNLIKCSDDFNQSNMLLNKLKKKLINKNLSDEEYNNLIDIFIKMLDCDKNKRITVNELLNHPIFKNIK